MTDLPPFSAFSPHLFWDVDAEKLSWEENRKFIVQRVLEYGLIGDWRTLAAALGVKEIGETAAELRDLDDRSLYFIAALSHIPPEKFRCYISKQSTPPHWNF